MSGWPLKIIDEVCVVNPRLHRGHGLLDDSSVSFVPMAAVDEVSGAIADCQVRSYAEVKKGYTHFMDNDVLFAKITPCMENGKAAIANNLVGGFGFGSTEFHVLRSKGEVLPEWLFYFVRQSRFRAEAKRTFTGTAGQQRVPTTFLASTKIPVPSIAEQRRIVDILSRAEGIVKLRREAEKKAAELIPALFLDMFGDPATNPKGWPKSTVSEVSTRVTKGESPKWQGFEYGNVGIRFVTSENVLWGSVDLEKEKYVPEAFHKKLNRSALVVGDLLINLVGASVGRAAIVPEEALPANINQAVAVTTLDQKKCLPEFLLAHVLANSTQQKLLGNVVEAARANISLANIRELQVMLPPLDTQGNFVERVNEVRSIQSQQTAATATAQATFDALLSQVFDA